MNLCSDNHVEICYNESYCPICEILVELEDKKQEILNLQEDLDNVNS